MKFTLEHALILILAIAVIYYIIQHRNLVKDVLSIPDRGHPELKRVKGKHSSDDIDCSKPDQTIDCVPVNKNGHVDVDDSIDLLSYCGYNKNAGFDECDNVRLETPITNNHFYQYNDISTPIETGGDMWCNKQANTNSERRPDIQSTGICEFDDLGFGKVRGKKV